MIHKPLCNDIYIASCHKEGGIYHYRLFEDGKIEYKDFTPMDRPMYMVKHDGKMYILLREPFSDNKNSGLVTCDIANDGSLSEPSDAVSTGGEVACHLCVDENGVYCVNYISGSVIKMPSKTVTHFGHGVNLQRQNTPHTHFVGVSGDSKFVYVTDLGLDSLFVYDKELNPIARVSVPSGHGARHLAITDKYIYCVNELKSSLSVFSCKNNKLFYENTVSVLPKDYIGESTASAIRVKDNLCYIANRGHDSVSVMDISSIEPKLVTTVDICGNFPRDINIWGDILISANELSDNVTFFAMENGIPQNAFNELKIKSAFCILV